MVKGRIKPRMFRGVVGYSKMEHHSRMNYLFPFEVLFIGIQFIQSETQDFITLQSSNRVQNESRACGQDKMC
jgi:hypothetical protein